MQFIGKKPKEDHLQICYLMKTVLRQIHRATVTHMRMVRHKHRIHTEAGWENHCKGTKVPSITLRDVFAFYSISFQERQFSLNLSVTSNGKPKKFIKKKGVSL